MMNLRYDMRVVKAVIVREFKTWYEHPFWIVSEILSSVIWTAMLVIIFRGMFGGTANEVFYRVTGMEDYVSYLILGTVFSHYTNAVTWGMGMTFSAERGSTLEILMNTPMNEIAFLFGKSVFNMFRTTLSVGYLLIICSMVFGLSLSPTANYLVAIVGLIVGIIAMSGLGIIFAGLCLMTRDPGGMLNIIQLPLFALSGMWYPIEIFPSWLRTISYGIPLTYLLKVVRQPLLKGSGFQELTTEFTALALFAIVLPVVGYIIFRYLDKIVRARGSHIYI